MRIVVDTSVLIALSNIGRLELLRSLFDDVMVPRAVMEEYGEPLPEWVKVVEVKDKQLVRALLGNLHRGEAEVIALALEANADIVILDDKKARNIARRIGLNVMGTIGILILAKKQSLINNIEAEISKLTETSFRLSRDVITKAIEESKKDC